MSSPVLFHESFLPLPHAGVNYGCFPIYARGKSRYHRSDRLLYTAVKWTIHLQNEVVPNTPVGLNRGAPFHLTPNRNVRNFWHNKKHPMIHKCVFILDTHLSSVIRHLTDTSFPGKKLPKTPSLGKRALKTRLR